MVVASLIALLSIAIIVIIISRSTATRTTISGELCVVVCGTAGCV